MNKRRAHVTATPFKELLMSSRFRYGAILEKEDDVGILDRRQSMRDRHGGSSSIAPDGLVECCLYHSL